MPTKIGIGFSSDVSLERAVKDAAFQAKTNLNTDRVDLAFILSTVHYHLSPGLPIIQRILNPKRMVGSSTAGIILTDKIHTKGIAILCVYSDEIQFGLGSVSHITNENADESGRILAHSCITDFGKHARHTFLFFSDAHLENSSPLLKGIQEIFGNVFPIIGAGSSDDFHFADTFQVYQDKVLQQAATGLMLGGIMSVGVGSRHGWRPLGKPRVIDDSEGNIIKSIDGKKASYLYEEYFGSEAEELHARKLGTMAILYPLGINIEGSKEYLLKNAVDITKDGSIVCQGDVSVGSEVHIMIGNKDSCKQAAFEAAQEAQNDLRGKAPKLILIIESMARLKLLGRTAIEEVFKIKEVFGDDVPIFGMYSNGEISPLQLVEKFKRPHIQNESIVILAIG